MTAGIASWWLGFVWFGRVWPKPQFDSVSKLLSRAIELSDPDAEQSFLQAYTSLLRETVRIAWYRIHQSVFALFPFGLGLWLAWAIEYSWIYLAVTTVTTLALGTYSLFNRPRQTDHHATNSQ